MEMGNSTSHEQRRSQKNKQQQTQTQQTQTTSRHHGATHTTTTNHVIPSSKQEHTAPSPGAVNDQLQDLSMHEWGDSDLSLKRENELTRQNTNLIFTDDNNEPVVDDNGRLIWAKSQGATVPGNVSRIPSGNEVLIEDATTLSSSLMDTNDDYDDVPLQRVDTGATCVEVVWDEGGDKVYVTGDFVHWRNMVPLKQLHHDGVFRTTIYLTPGPHRVEFIVDNEPRFNRNLPTASDSDGRLYNYIEVGLSHANSFDGGGDRMSVDNNNNNNNETGHHHHHRPEAPAESLDVEYTTEIPEACQKPEQADALLGDKLVAPPVLPPQLETAVVNSTNATKDDSSVLPTPNHVVINHLATTSIKNNVLAVATTCRYSRKFVTQILYAPL